MGGICSCVKRQKIHSPLPHSRRESSVTEELQVPDLPDDVIRLIFSELSTKDRLPLAFVSKRVHKIDLEIGNRVFEDVFFTMSEEKDLIEAMITKQLAQKVKLHRALGVHEDSYVFEAPPKGLFHHPPPGIEQLMKGATMNTFMIHCSNRRVPEASDEFLNLIVGLTFSSLWLCLDCSPDFTEFLFRVLETVNSSKTKRVMLTWQHMIGQNKTRLQKALEKLPRNLDYIAIANRQEEMKRTSEMSFHVGQDGCLITGPMAVPVIRCAKIVHITSVQCTAQELLDVFEAASEANFYRICMNVIGVDNTELFRLAEKKGFEVFDVFIKDLKRKCSLAILRNRQSDSQMVSMYKTDENGDRVTNNN